MTDAISLLNVAIEAKLKSSFMKTNVRLYFALECSTCAPMQIPLTRVSHLKFSFVINAIISAHVPTERTQIHFTLNSSISVTLKSKGAYFLPLIILIKI